MTAIPDGWPCALLATDPPSVADRQSAPSADDLLPQVLALTPRGAAWGSDGLGDGSRTSPVMRSFWHAIAAWVADLNTRDFQVATQAFPSAITSSLADWEREFGLPDLCAANDGSTEARITAVRGRFAAVGGSSPAYFICLAKSIGYDVTIEEPSQFHCDLSECDGPDQVAGGLVDEFFRCDEGRCDDTPLESWAPDPNGSLWKFWIVHVTAIGSTYFRCDEGQCDLDPLEGNLPATGLECLLRRDSPPHTELIFSYDQAA